MKLFSDPFYSNGPNDQGVGWNVLASLQRVAVGFGLAALVGIVANLLLPRQRQEVEGAPQGQDVAV